MKNEIIIFENQNVKLEVNMKDETVWLSLDQMAKLFDRDKSVISRHIKNALKEELEESSTVANFATVAKEGERNVSRNIEYYNLDMIISAVKLIDIASRNLEGLDNIGASDIIKVLQRYTKSLDLLDDYDHKSLVKPKGTKSEEKITYKNCIDIIKTLKFNEKSEIFAMERDKGLESIINNIYQTFDGKDVYESIEEKAANFLYTCVKNHVFIDGNKRIAATLFIYFLQFYGILYLNDRAVIDNNTLASLTLLIAQSNPKERKLLIHLIMNFLV